MKNILLFSYFFFVFTSNIFSQSIFFTEKEILNDYSLAWPGDFKVFDIDSDGKQDIVITSKNNNSVYWIKNIDATINSFSDLKPLLLNYEKSGILSINDINGDGNIDIIIASRRRANICWMKNLNNEEFSKIDINNKTDGISAIITTDIDGDNDIDIIVAYWEGKKISYFENTNGKGNFSEEKDIKTGIGTVSNIAFIDMDGDSLKDIVATLSEQNKIVYYKNNGTTNNFTESHIIAENLSDPSAFTIDDVDNDGDNDLIVAVDNKVLLFKNIDNNGNFAEDQQIYNKNYSINSIIAVDIDHDNDKDIILGNSEYGNILYFQNTDGLGTFSKDTTLLSGFPGTYYLDIVDLNKNGKSELIATSVYDNKLIWMESKENGFFNNPLTIFESDLQEPYRIVCGDFNSDGLTDILIDNDRKNNLCWFKNNNNGEPFEFNMITENDGATDRLIAKSDFDNDGDLDFLITKTNNGLSVLVLYENKNGNGDFLSKALLINNLPNISFINLIDIDKDGDQDILFLSEENNIIAYIKNKGQGQFERNFVVISNQLVNPSAITISDFDDDGDLDIVAASKSQNQMVYLRNNNGNYALLGGNIQNPIQSPLSISSGDIDDDGDIDLVFSSNSDYGVFCMKNSNGLGKFETPYRINNNFYYSPDKIILKDIDKDGDIDILLFNKSREKISFYENINGIDSFKNSVDLLNNEYGLISFDIADIDNDSYEDVISISNRQNNILCNKTIPVPTFSLQPKDTILCDSALITLKVDFDKADSIRWQSKSLYSSNFNDIYNNVFYSGVRSKSLSFKATTDFNKTQYRCKLFYKNHYFFSDTATIKVNALILANAGADDSTCYDKFYLYGSYPGAGTGLWKVVKGNANITSPNNSTTQVTGLSSGENIFRWIITNGICSDSSEVTVMKVDSAAISKQPEDIQINSGNQAEFNITATGKINSYNWFFNNIKLEDNDSITGSQTNTLIIKNVTVENKGTYKCLIKGYCNSLYSDNAILDIISSTSENLNESVKIFPNPAYDVLYIKNNIEIKSLSIIDINNKTIWSNNGKINSIDLSTFLPGIYFIKIKTKNNLLRYKFIKI
jgi:hypothetical protein